MPVRPLEAVVVTTPAHTPASAPLDTSVRLRRGLLGRIRVRIPSGHVGITGLRLLYADQIVLPFSIDEWVRGNDDLLDFDLALEVGAQPVVIRTFNDDAFDHSHVVYFDVDEGQAALPRMPIGVGVGLEGRL